MSDLKELTDILRKLENPPNINDKNLPLLRKALELITKIMGNKPEKPKKKAKNDPMA